MRLQISGSGTHWKWCHVPVALVVEKADMGGIPELAAQPIQSMASFSDRCAPSQRKIITSDF